VHNFTHMQGEAIAFALGGNRKMLRTGSLAGLLNQELAAAGHREAEVGTVGTNCQPAVHTPRLLAKQPSQVLRGRSSTCTLCRWQVYCKPGSRIDNKIKHTKKALLLPCQ
jgi:hypothetical protein